MSIVRRVRDAAIEAVLAARPMSLAAEEAVLAVWPTSRARKSAEAVPR